MKFDKIKSCGLIVFLLVLIGMIPVMAASLQLQALGVAASTMNGAATHVVVVDWADFSTTTTNTPEANTVSIGAGTYVELVKMDLVRAFDTANTNYTGAFAVTVGDADDVDKYLASTEIAADGTEVWCAPGLTGAYYATATNVLFTFTPNAEEATSANSAGEVEFYFRVW